MKPLGKPAIRGSGIIMAMFWLVFASILIPHLSFAQDKVIATYTLPDTPIKAFQNTVLPGSVANDRKVLLGSVGSDLWHGPKDARDEFWMVTDRGPNGQIAVDGKNRRTFWVPEFNPTILRVKTEGKAIKILDAIPIVGQSGKPVTGLPNLKDVDEAAYNYSAQEHLPVNPNGLDTEGLVRTTAGDFWISEEYSPSIIHVDRTGKVIKRYIPEGLNLEGPDMPSRRFCRRSTTKERSTAASRGSRLAAMKKPSIWYCKARF